MDIFAAGCVLYKIVKDKCRVVVIKKAATGHWSLPKGKFVPPETSKQAALRELSEETGIEGKLGKRIDTVHYSYKSGDGVVDKHVVFFIADFVKGKLVPGEPEVCDVKWVDINAAYKLLDYPLEKKILKKAEFLISCKV